MTTVTVAVGCVAAPAGVPCDIWSSSEGDCHRPATFKYADPKVNTNHPNGPRNFCEEHVGCATLALLPIGA